MYFCSAVLMYFHSGVDNRSWGVGSRARVPQVHWLSRDARFGRRATPPRY